MVTRMGPRDPHAQPLTTLLATTPIRHEVLDVVLDVVLDAVLATAAAPDLRRPHLHPLLQLLSGYSLLGVSGVLLVGLQLEPERISIVRSPPAEQHAQR